MSDDNLTQRDLAALKEWIRAEFKIVDSRLDAMAKATELQARDREKIDERLNDVRTRFVPRAEYEALSKDMTDVRTRFVARPEHDALVAEVVKSFEVLRTDIDRRFRSLTVLGVAVVAVGLTAVTLLFSRIGL